MAKQDLGAARAANSLNFFKCHEANWMLQRTLAYMNVNAAELGECLYVATKINEKDAESWPREWSRLAEKVYMQGEESLLQEDKISARNSFLRASNYYRAAQYGCIPDHKDYDMLLERSVDAFEKASKLYDPVVKKVSIEFEGTSLPGYFWRADNSDKKRPTLFVAGGNDDTIEEDFMIIAQAAINRGYNFFTFSYPGHRNAVHTDNKQVKRYDYEVPFKKAFDVLEEQVGVDERIALAGFSGGGYVAPRVAIYEDRVKVLIANNPMIDYARVADALLGPLVRGIPSSLLSFVVNKKLEKKPLMKAYMEYGLYTAGYQDYSLVEWLKSNEAQQEWAKFNIVDKLDQITVPTLSLVGSGEGEEMIKQTKEFHSKISSGIKEMKMFTLEKDGSHDHCMLDNHSRMHQEIFTWLNSVFDIRS